MRFLVCPQCGINRFFVLNAGGDRVLVQVTRNYEILPINHAESLDGFNLDLLLCLGCSWKGTKDQLVKYIL